MTNIKNIILACGFTLYLLALIALFMGLLNTALMAACYGLVLILINYFLIK